MLWITSIQNIFIWEKGITQGNSINTIFNSAFAEETVVLNDLEASKKEIDNEGFSNEAWEVYLTQALNLALAAWYATAGQRCALPGLKCNWLMIVTTTAGIVHMSAELMVWIMMFFVKKDYTSQLSRLTSGKSKKKGFEVDAFRECLGEKEDEKKAACLEEAGVEEGQGSVQVEVLKKVIELYEQQKFALELKRIFLIAVEAMNILITTMEYLDAAGENLKDSQVVLINQGIANYCASNATASASNPATASCTPLDTKCAAALQIVSKTELTTTARYEQSAPTKPKCSLRKTEELKKVSTVLSSCAAACCSQLTGQAAIKQTIKTAERRTCEGLREAKGKVSAAQSKVKNTAARNEQRALWQKRAGISVAKRESWIAFGARRLTKAKAELAAAKAELGALGCSYPCQVKAPPLVHQSVPKKKKWFSSFMELGGSFLLPKKALSSGFGDWLDEELRIVIFSLMAIVAIIFVTLDTAADSWFYTPLSRGIFSTVATIIVGYQIAQNEAAHSTVISNIDKLKTLTAEFEGSVSTPTGIDTLENRLTFSDDVDRNFEGQFLQDFKNTQLNKEIPCAGGKAPDGKGGCLSTAKGISNAFDKIGFQDLAGIKSDLISVGDELSGRKNINSAAISGLGSIGNKRDALKKILEKAKLDLNKTRGLLGLQAIDPDKQARGLLSKLKANVLQTLKENNIGPSELSSAFGGAAVSKGVKGSNKKQRETLKKIKAAAAKNLDVSEETIDSGFSFQFDKQEDSNSGITDESINALRENTDKYKIDKGDISKRSKDDIFKMITTRYFKSALPVLVEELD